TQPLLHCGLRLRHYRGTKSSVFVRLSIPPIKLLHYVMGNQVTYQSTYQFVASRISLQSSLPSAHRRLALQHTIPLCLHPLPLRVQHIYQGSYTVHPLFPGLFTAPTISDAQLTVDTHKNKNLLRHVTQPVKVNFSHEYHMPLYYIVATITHDLPPHVPINLCMIANTPTLQIL
ncbi:Hypothetical predicted protein, partial [Pelobates cultripes]